MKSKFAHIQRDGGERYFEHLREVFKNVMNLPNPNVQKAFIALAHDSIEDTDKTYE
jgi:(p)ppGpp synthase/HD superfamily hydrolase